MKKRTGQSIDGQRTDAAGQPGRHIATFRQSRGPVILTKWRHFTDAEIEAAIEPEDDSGSQPPKSPV